MAVDDRPRGPRARWSVEPNARRWETVLGSHGKAKLGRSLRAHCRRGDIRGLQSTKTLEIFRRGSSSAVLAMKQEGGVMKIKPLHDRVVIRRIEEEARTPGGVIIPDTAKEKPMQGEVVAVGPGARDESGKRIEPDVKEGDTILFGKWSGTEVTLDGEELIIMKESDILGIIETSAAKAKAA
jgi:chaperonin GroES